MNSSCTPAPVGEKKGFDAATFGFVALIFALALALRLVWVVGFPHPIEFPDEKQYLNIGENFVRDGALQITTEPATGQPLHYPLDLHRPPVYPLTLAVFMKLELSETFARSVQAVFGALSCVMLYLLARRLAGEWPGRIAGLLFAVDPFSVYFTGLFLSETLFALVFVTSWYFIVRAWQEVSAGEKAGEWAGSCLLAGLLAALAALTRPEALAAYALVPPAWIFFGPRRLKGLLVSALFALVLLIGLSPWVARNYKRTWDSEAKSGHIVLTTCNVGESLYEAVGPYATGGPNKQNTVWPTDSDLLYGDEWARDRYLYEKSRDVFFANPARALRLAEVKVLRTWNVFPNFEGVRSTRNKVVSAAFLIPVYLAAILGIAALCRRRELLWTLLPILAITAMHAVFVGSVRYRLPMEPFLCVLSGAGAVWLVSTIFGRRPAANAECPRGAQGTEVKGPA